MKQKTQQERDGLTVEVIEQSGVRTEIWRDGDGKVVDIVKRIKTDGDPRTQGPKGNEQKRPA